MATQIYCDPDYISKKRQLVDVLEDVRRNGTYIQFERLCWKLGLTAHFRHDRHFVAHLLRKVDEERSRCGECSLAVLVYNKHDQCAGPGYGSHGWKTRQRERGEDRYRYDARQIARTLGPELNPTR